MSKKYYLCGYYGMENSGDDALLLSTMLGTSRYLGVGDFAINSPRQLHVPRRGVYQPRLAKQQSFRGENRLRQCFAAMRSNSVIFGGGSVFHCARDIKTKRLMMKLAGKGPHLALGVGLGPFSNQRAERECARFLNQCSYTGVRDHKSFEIAKSIAPHANVEQTFDLAPALTEEMKQVFADDDFTQGFRRGIGVALCPRERLSSSGTGASQERVRIRAIAAALTQAHRATGEPIFLIDFNGHASFGDAPVHNELHRYIPASVPVFRVPYDPNPVRVMTRLAKLKMMVSMRLHGSILSYMTDTPVISINYHSKCDGWCDQVGMHKNYRFDANQIDNHELADVIVEGLSTGFAPCDLPLQGAYQLALKNFTSPQILRA